jgi:hypothetical protein
LTAANPYPNLPYDPCPGDLAGYQTLSDYANRSAGWVEQAAKVLALAQSPEWAGQSADAFREHVHADVLPLVNSAASSVGKAANALRAWYLTLSSLQQEAQSLNRQAAPYASELAAANSSLPASERVVPGQSATATPLSPFALTLTPAQQTARANAEAAAGALGGIIGKVDDLHQQYLTAVRQCANQLDLAGNMAPKPPGFWDSLGHDVEHYWDDAVGGVSWLVHDAKFWQSVSEIANIVSTVAGILALFPPLGVIFGPVALFSAGLALGSDLILAGFDGGSLVTVGLDAAAVVGGLGVWKAVKVLTGVYRDAGATKALETPSIAGLLAKSDLILRIPKVGDAVKNANQTMEAVPGLFRMIGQTFKDPAGTSELSKAIRLDGAPAELLDKAAPWRTVDMVCSGAGWALTGMSIPGTLSTVHGWISDDNSGGSP